MATTTNFLKTLVLIGIFVGLLPAATDIDLREHRVSRNPATGHMLPKVHRRDGATLTPADSRRTAEQISRAYLMAETSVFAFSPSEVSDLRLIVNDAARDATFIAFNQTVEGYDVFEGHVKVVLSKRGEVLQVSTGDVAPGLRIEQPLQLSKDDARSAAKNLTGEGGVFSGTDELVVFALEPSRGRLAYRLFLDVDDTRAYEILVDAADGSILYRHNNIVFAGQANIFKESPQKGPRELISMPDSWLDASATTTTGNNVEVYLDADGNDVADNINNAQMKTGHAFSDSQIFDFPFVDGLQGADPRLAQPAAITNLFYFVNIAHDYFYNLGFDEAAGNFQTDNGTNGGVGADSVIARAQHGLSTNNASFQPSADGTRPQMRMGLFTRSTSATTDDLDSSFDGGVVLHEYGHGVSNRLVGARVSTSCLSQIQSGAMGEGWSDYFASTYYDSPITGTYLTQNQIRGIRRQSYEGYTFTYEDIGNAGYEVHNDGEIWAAMLWDLRKSLGKEITDRLVINGLKATPCRPSMVDARDAMLTADLAANSGANRTAMWTVFARHGFGFSAAGTDGTLSSGTVYNAAYDMPPDLQGGAVNPKITSTPPGAITGQGEAYPYKVVASNPNNGTLTFSSSAPSDLTVAGDGTLQWNGSIVPTRVKITVTDAAGGKVIHGFIARMLTRLVSDSPLIISGPTGITGNAFIDVPPDQQILQIALRGGFGNPNLTVIGPAVGGASTRSGTPDTLSFASPAPGRWSVFVTSSAAYTNVSLSAALINPQVVERISETALPPGVQSSEVFYRVNVPKGTNNFRVETSGGVGDVDLFVRRSHPAVCQPFGPVSEPCSADFGAFHDGNAEVVNIANPVPGDYFIDLSAFLSYSNVTMKVSMDSPIGASPGAVLFFAASGGTAPAPQDIEVSATPGPLNEWSAQKGSGSAWLSLDKSSGSGPAAIRLSANPAGLPVGLHSTTLTLTSGASSVVVDVTLSIPATPALPANGIIGGAASNPLVTSISPRGFATIYGTNLAPPGTLRSLTPVDLDGRNLPTNLAGTCVDVDGLPAYITFASTGQINFQVPLIRTALSVPIVVKANCGTASELKSTAVNVPSLAATPEFLYLTRPENGQYGLLAVDALSFEFLGIPGSAGGLSVREAKPDSFVTIYGVSFGNTSPSYAPGTPPTASATTSGVKPVVTLNGTALTAADVAYAGASPGTAGLYQLNIHLPPLLPDGDYAVVMTLPSGQSTPAGYLRVKR